MPKIFQVMIPSQCYNLKDKGKPFKQQLEHHETLNSPFEAQSNEISTSSHPRRNTHLYYHSGAVVRGHPLSD